MSQSISREPSLPGRTMKLAEWSLQSSTTALQTWWRNWLLHIYRFLLSSTAPWVVAESLIVAGIVGHASLHHIRINHDCAGFITVAQQILDGELPYIDICDVNPPWIMYLNVPPYWVARTLGVAPTLTFSVFVSILLVLSWIELRAVLRRSQLSFSTAELAGLSFGWLATHFIIYWSGDYGQREHLFALAYAPLLAARVVRREGGTLPKWLWIGLGLQGSMGACIKPHFVFAVVVVEGVLFLGRRNWRSLISSEMLAFWGFVAAYLAHWLFVPAAMRDAFFFRWIPFIAKHYQAYQRTFADIVWNTPLCMALGIGLAGWLLLSAKAFRNPLLQCLVAGAIAAWLGCLQQMKAWTYHYLPFECLAALAVVLTAILIGRVVSRSPEGGRMRLAAVHSAFFIEVVAAAIAIHAFVADGLAVEPLKLVPGSIEAAIAENSSTGDRVMIYCTSAVPMFPLFPQVNRRMGSRYPQPWPIASFSRAAAQRGESEGRLLADAPPIEQRFIAECCEDIVVRRPSLIVVRTEKNNQGCPEDFCISDYLHQMGVLDFIAASGYRPVSGPQGWMLYVQSK